ncbi:hypothetical protein GCM10017083_07200 [Thalassobaculum fulvum]|uniref:Uncharacterized protein n=1 Tax=Thalassobaculum fulvum TaxID=1633335 RepID=A0A918XQ05_9PROT|nr:hypothetical protein [Thalassobaculum fulvum]GHD42312.1 hypothetical protein GCM10017083_07200 [Thalassobaculum fulvum]
MPLAPGLQVRTLVRPGGRVTTVVVRRRRTSPIPPVERRGPQPSADTAPPPRAAGPDGRSGERSGFSRPIVRALVALGSRAWPLGRDGLALDGRRVPLARLVAEANRALTARGCPPIPYPGVRPKEGRPKENRR